ncbi:MAG TPA: tetratricopeptide repeat protein [Chitinispirillaceae bacterium]|nr:tetratricopeptide repeat protein [Chitinispirillaceae bacterium]
MSCCRSGSLIETGEVNLRLGDYHRARVNFEEAVNRFPKSSLARLGLGKALLQQYSSNSQDSTILIDCIIQLEAARTLNPDKEVEKLLSIVWFKRAKIHLGKEDTIAALQALSRSISLDPRAPSPVNLAGILYFYRGEKDKALNLFRLVTTLDTASVSGYFNTGMIYWADSNYVQAYQNWFKAAQNSPQDKEILTWAARAKEQYSGAIK